MVTSPFTLIPPFTAGTYPFSGVQPFTYKDAETNVEFLGRIVTYLRSLVDQINDANKDFYDEIIVKLNETITQVNNALSEQSDWVINQIDDLQETVTEQINQMIATVNAQLTDNEAAMDVLQADVTAQLAANNQAIANLAAQVAAFSDALNNALTIDDALIAMNIDAPASLSRQRVNDAINVAEFNRGNRVSTDYGAVLINMRDQAHSKIYYFPDGTYTIKTAIFMEGCTFILAENAILNFDHVGSQSVFRTCEFSGGTIEKTLTSLSPFFSYGSRISNTTFNCDIEIYDSNVLSCVFVKQLSSNNSTFEDCSGSSADQSQDISIGLFTNCRFGSVTSMSDCNIVGGSIGINAAMVSGTNSFRDVDVSVNAAITFDNAFNLFDNCDIYVAAFITIAAKTSFNFCNINIDPTPEVAFELVVGSEESVFEHCKIVGSETPNFEQTQWVSVRSNNVKILNCNIDFYAFESPIVVVANNCVVENNYIKSHNGFYAISIQGSRNLLRNNTFDGKPVVVGGAFQFVEDNKVINIASKNTYRYDVSATDSTIIHRDTLSFTYAVSTPSPGYFVVSINPAARRNRIEVYGVPFYQNAGNDLPAIQGETLTNNCDCFADQVQYGLAGASGQYVSTSFSHSVFVSGNVTYLPARARTGTMITLNNNGATTRTVGGGSPSNIAGVTNLTAGQAVNMVKGANGTWFPSTVF